MSLSERSRPENLKTYRFPSAEDLFVAIVSAKEPSLLGVSKRADLFFVGLGQSFSGLTMNGWRIAMGYAAALHEVSRDESMDRQSLAYLSMHFEDFVKTIVQDQEVVADALGYMEAIEKEIAKYGHVLPSRN